MPDAPIKLSRLPLRERRTITAQLERAAADALTEGWQLWELDEAVKAHGRGLGVRLTAAEATPILGETLRKHRRLTHITAAF